MTDRVAVIIAAYNAQDTIGRAIYSALADPAVSEVIVVDDASQDQTVTVAKSCEDGTARLKVFVQPLNNGPAAARNRAILESRSAWITILDADDFYQGPRISKMLEHADKAEMIADDMWQVCVDAIDGPKKQLLDGKMALPCTVSLEEFILSNVTRKGHERAELGFIKPLIKRSHLQEHNISYRENMRLGEDYDLYARILATGGRLYLLPAQGYVSVVRPDSLSGRHRTEDLKALRDCNIMIKDDYDLPQSARNALWQHYIDTDCRYQWRVLIEAVKHKKPLAAIQTFLRPWPVPLSNLKHLWEQVEIRVFKSKAAS